MCWFLMLGEWSISWTILCRETRQSSHWVIPKHCVWKMVSFASFDNHASTHLILGSTSSHPLWNCFPGNTNPGLMESPIALTHSIIVTSSRFPLRWRKHGCLFHGTKYFSAEVFLPPPRWQPFSSMFQTFSQGISRSQKTFSRSSKWFVMVVRLKHWTHFGSRPEGFPSLRLGCRARNLVIHCLPGLVRPPVMSWTFFRSVCLLRGTLWLLSSLSHSTTTHSCMMLRLCWYSWALRAFWWSPLILFHSVK